MKCRQCGVQLGDGAQTCFVCGVSVGNAGTANGEPLPAAQTALPLESPAGGQPKKPQRKKPSFFLGLMCGVLIAVLTAVLLLGTGTLSLGSTKIEGSGFSTPEQAAGAYLKALSQGDLEATLACFAVETAVEHYNLRAELEWSESFDKHIDMLPATSDFYVVLNVQRQVASILQMIRIQYVELQLHQGYPSAETDLSGEGEYTVDTFLAALDGTVTHSFLTGMRMGYDEDYLTPEELLGDRIEYYDAMNNQVNAIMFQEIGGYDELMDFAVRVTLFGEESADSCLFLFSAVRYGGRWYLGGFGGSLAGLVAETAGYTGFVHEA